VLAKMEDKIQYLCEARNHLNWKDKLTTFGLKSGLENFEFQKQKEKAEAKLREFKQQQK
jgi:hypothetical protein